MKPSTPHGRSTGPLHRALADDVPEIVVTCEQYPDRRIFTAACVIPVNENDPGKDQMFAQHFTVMHNRYDATFDYTRYCKQRLVLTINNRVRKQLARH